MAESTKEKNMEAVTAEVENNEVISEEKPINEETVTTPEEKQAAAIAEVSEDSVRRVFATDGRISNVRKTEENDVPLETKAGLMELRHCKNERRAITATVYAIESVSIGDIRSAVAVLMYYHKGVNTGIKIVIPFKKFLEQGSFRMDPDFDEVSNETHALSLRQGSEVDVYITSVVDKDCVAAGDRLSAMRDKENSYYKRDSNSSVCEGDIVTSRIVSVNRRGITVEALGVETFIPSRELTYRHLSDISPYFRVGDTVEVLIGNISTDENSGRIVLSDCSVKGAMVENEDPYVKASRILKVSGHYEGVVDYVDRNNGSFYVNPLHTNIDLYCPEPPIQRLPHVGDRVSVIVSVIDVEKKHFYGRIVYFAGKNSVSS